MKEVTVIQQAENFVTIYFRFNWNIKRKILYTFNNSTEEVVKTVFFLSPQLLAASCMHYFSRVSQ